MASSINTNVASLNAQRSLARTQSTLQTSMTRLSSGLRVNSAKDDAAGLAIAERMTAQVRGMNVAVRNANDGISLAQTAEGALGQVGSALQRMRELAVQARNSTNSASDKDSLNKEFGELQKEISRVIGGTTFNGKTILGADAGTMAFQVGANTGSDDTISIAMQNLSSASAIVAVAGAAPPSAATLAAATAAAKTAVVDGLNAKGWAVDSAWTDSHFGSVSSAAGAAEEFVRASLSNPVYGATFLGAETGISGASSATQANTITRDNMFALSGFMGDADSGAVLWGNLAQSAYEAFAAVAPAASGGASIGASIDSAALAQVVTDVDSAIAYISDQRATFGATQSRFESVIGNLQIGIENQSAARSRIMDADFASETAHLSRAQILQQAGTAMIAQANQAPQIVLQLLR